MSTRKIQNALDKNYSISVTYIPNNETVSFSSYLENFKDDYKQNWTPEEVYGRMDPIFFYKNTTRKINILFHVPSDDLGEAQANFKKLSKLIRFCYPVYEKGLDIKVQTGEPPATPPPTIAGAATSDVASRLSSTRSTLNSVSGRSLLLSSPPLIAVRYANLISSEKFGGKLIGKFNSINFEADKNSNFFTVNGNIFPSYFKVNLDMDVLHVSPLGYERDDNGNVSERTSRFPYKV